MTAMMRCWKSGLVAHLWLDFEIDNAMRLKAVKLDLARIDGLMAPFFERATKDRDVAAGTLGCKLLERRALLLGLDSPTEGRPDTRTINESKQDRSQQEHSQEGHDSACRSVLRPPTALHLLHDPGSRDNSIICVRPTAQKEWT